MSAALAAHDALARDTVIAHHGSVIKRTGDGICAAFDDPIDALEACVALQRALGDSDLTRAVAMRVRCGLHSGEVERRDDDVFGPTVNRAARVMAAAHGGQVVMSNAIAETVAARLPDPMSLKDLGRARLKGLPAPEHLFQLLHPSLRESFPPLRDLEATPNNLPQSATSFVGRMRELATIDEMLGHARHVTLTGFGGIGKTRLALQAAATRLDAFPDGVWLVELDTVADGAHVPQAIAAVLGLRDEPGHSLVDALVSYLQSLEVLIVLDNCEHVLAAAADLCTRVLRSTSRVRILATSREPLRTAGESVYPVSALALPATRMKSSVDELLAYEAVRLFADRAASVNPAFAITAKNASSVESICRQLSGIPLAIELAAARARGMSVEDIEARLTDHFRLLTHGDRMAPVRRQALRASIDWSHQLLLPAEQMLLARLSVFAGSFALDAVEAVCVGEALTADDVIDALERLVDTSFIAGDVSVGRYHMLETVRQYATEKVLATPDVVALRTRHVAWYSALAEKARSELFGPDQHRWLARLDTERENLLAAHAACDELPGTSELGFQLINALQNYWTSRGMLALGHRVTLEMLARPGMVARDNNRARALFNAGWLAYLRGRYEEAQTHLEESVAIGRELGSLRRVAQGLQPLGMVCLTLGKVTEARAHLDEAVAFAERLGEPRHLAAAMNQLGQLLRMQHDLDGAERLFGRVLQISSELGDRESVAIAQINLAMTALLNRANDRARTLLSDVHRTVVETSAKPLAQGMLDACAALSATAGRWTDAAGLYGAAEALAAETGMRRDVADQRFIDPYIDECRVKLGDTAFQREVDARKSVDLDMLLIEVGSMLEGRD